MRGGVPDLLGTPVNISQSNGFTVCERGVLCKKDDISGFVRGLKYLVKSDGSKNKERIKKAREFIKQRYSQERLLNDIEAIYLKLMEKE